MIKIISKKKYEMLRKRNKELEMESLKKKADLDFLQSQINPHFLYNSLDSIRGLAILNNVDEIADITESLANFFRYSIDAKKNIISLSQEIKIVENYFNILKYRFDDRYNFIVQHNLNEEQLTEIKIPKLILQPLVENAINHAFNKKNNDCEIKISIQKLKDNLKINVKDNGLGISEEKLIEIKQAIINTSEIGSGQINNFSLGIALKNVRKRINLFFGENASLVINSMEDIGTDVEMFLPLRFEDDLDWDF